MTPAPNSYSVQAHYPEVEYLSKTGGWLFLCNDRLEYCRGFLQARIELPLPHTALRLVRHKDGKVLHEVQAYHETGVGMVAGYPTGAQQLGAIKLALSRVRHHEGYVSQQDADLARMLWRILEEA